MEMGAGPEDVDGDKMERKLEEDFAINDGQIPNGSFLWEVEGILPILGIGLSQITKALRVDFGWKNHLRMPQHGNEDVSEEEEEEDGVPSRTRDQQRL